MPRPWPATLAWAVFLGQREARLGPGPSPVGPDRRKPSQAAPAVQARGLLCGGSEAQLRPLLP